MPATPTKPDLELAFDVGHSSLGWAVLKSVADDVRRLTTAGNPKPAKGDQSLVTSTATSVELLGCGVVTFGADDCLASKRRTARRQRRHYRSTRQRLERIAKVLLCVLANETREDAPRLCDQLRQYLDRAPDKRAALQGAGDSFPWRLAARVLRGEHSKPLTWPELWDVLRWIGVHN